MVTRTYTILGASGHIGHIIVQELLKKGHHVKALGRKHQKLEPLKALGAEIIDCKDFTQSDLILEALQNSDAAFCMIPPMLEVDDPVAYQNKVGEAIAEAVRKSGIKYVVNLSSIGAQYNEETGPVKLLALQEQRLNKINNLNVLHMRPSFFMENLLNTIPVIIHAGVLGTPIKPDYRMPMIATQDVGLKIAEILDRLDFKGHPIFDYAGPFDYTMNEATKILGKAIGKPDLKYHQLSYPEALSNLTAAGMSIKAANLMIELYQAINDNRLIFSKELFQDHRGKTNLEEFAKEFAAVFKQELAHAH